MKRVCLGGLGGGSYAHTSNVPIQHRDLVNSPSFYFKREMQGNEVGDWIDPLCALARSRRLSHVSTLSSGLWNLYYLSFVFCFCLFFECLA